jgi:hypothetical protein
MTSKGSPAPPGPLTALAAAEAKIQELGRDICAELPGFAFAVLIATPDGGYVTKGTNLNAQALVSLLLTQANNVVIGADAPAGKLAKGSTH